MPDTTVAPYGAWESPITADLIAAGGVRLGQICVDGADLYWSEGRPAEGGRVAVVRLAADAAAADAIPPPFSARSRVHEYGGGAFTVQQGTVFFVNDADQRVYRLDAGRPPRPITPPLPMRYADLTPDPPRDALLCVVENHAAPGGEPSNCIARLPAQGGHPTPLVTGRDFVAAPRPSPDGRQLAWLAWDHPHMPWDAAELWIADMTPDGSLRDARRVAGGPGDSCCLPKWSPDGVLHVVAERTGWWNLYRLDGSRLTPLCPLDAEFGIPHWSFGGSTYDFAPDASIICAWCHNAVWRIGRLDPASGALAELFVTAATYDDLCAQGGEVVFIGASDRELPAVMRSSLATGESARLRRSSPFSLPDALAGEAHVCTFATSGGARAHGFFYPPANAAYAAPPGELPPLIVMSHGGPTGDTRATLSLKIRYWTSRGFAVLDVNYRGSTGHGRAYRELLDGQWGVADVDDCCAGALWLAAEGRVDRERMAITGSSAGGYTTLACLTFRDVFRAGASYYGIGDLEALARDTHKFEARYLDRLVGPYPERRDRYLARSPVAHAERLACPVIFFQGLDDRVVPPSQSEAMVAALRAKGVPVEYFAFAGEGHGFRRAETIRAALEAELAFYRRVFRIGGAA